MNVSFRLTPGAEQLPAGVPRPGADDVRGASLGS